MNTGFASLTSKKIGASLKASFVLPILFLGVGAQAPVVKAQTPGTFTATGNMTTARYGHTATLLPNGKVLLAGGALAGLFSYPFSVVSAELYDPSTGKFTATGYMTTPRQQHTATLLPNGKVLIVGGETCNSSGCRPLASAELYDPSTGSFTATGNMTTARWGPTATLLNKYRVLIAGGALPAGPTASAELYDVSTERFTATGDMTKARAFHRASGKMARFPADISSFDLPV